MANLLFSKWLDNKLKELGIDAKVYNSYITGILEETGDEEEKRETITDILGSLIVNISIFSHVFIEIVINSILGRKCWGTY